MAVVLPGRIGQLVIFLLFVMRALLVFGAVRHIQVKDNLVDTAVDL